MSKERVLFTEEMRKEYTILMPMMLPIQFSLLEKVLNEHGYKTVLLHTNHDGIKDMGLESVHNDTCYPALLVIGQFLDALKSGKYDVNKTALLITQTGGGCRASNYIALLRKALEKNDLGHIPVISLSASGMEKNPGFKLTVPFIVHMGFSIMYGDLIMLLANQTRPYEVNKGDTDKLIKYWIDYLTKTRFALTGKNCKKTMRDIVKSFADIPLSGEEKILVGIVGEIYIKYSPLGNNDLENLLLREGAEPIVPGLLDFILYCMHDPIENSKMYKANRKSAFGSAIVKRMLVKMQNMTISAVKENSSFRAPSHFEETVKGVDGIISRGVQMGEGWLLTAEMVELIRSGVNNIVCAQPFGCLPNHIVGKGMIRRIRSVYENANIVSIDYDPGATKVNQENRIKLMLTSAKLSAKNKQKANC